jgi:hypothetical protein
LPAEHGQPGHYWPGNCPNAFRPWVLSPCHEPPL